MKTILRIALLMFLFTCTTIAAHAQWPQSSSFFYKDKGVITPAPVSQTLSGGTYNEGSSFFVKCAVNVTAGRVYHFTLTTTGSKPSSNCLRLLNNACCGSATNYASNTGAAATITWTATLTGTIYVCMIDNSNCSQLFGALGTETVNLAYFYSCQNASTPALSVSNNCGNSVLTITNPATDATFLWSDGGTDNPHTVTTSGAKTVTQTLNGCTTAAGSATATPLAVPAAVSVSGGATQCGGSVTLTASGGNGGTIYFQGTTSGGTSTATASSSQSVSASGTYYFRSKSAQGCWGDEGSATVTIHPPVTISHTKTDAACFGDANGSVDLTINSGTSPYDYSWSNGATTSAVSGLSSGTYSVIVTDANGCTNTQNISISEPTAIGIPVTISQYSGYNISIHGASDGSIAPDPYGGTTSGFGMSGYRYSWSTGATTRVVSALIAGIYSLTVADAHNCTATGTYTLTEPTVMVLDTIISPVLNGGHNLLCHGGTDGSVHIAVHGAVPPYSFQWSNGAFTQDVSGLAAGSYMLRILDANGAQIDTSIILTQPAAIIISVTPSYYPNGFNLSGLASNDGSFTSAVSGGIAAYSYQWTDANNGTTVATTQNASSLNAGLYTLTITDANGCTADKSKWLFQPAYGGGWDLKGNSFTDADSNYIGTKDSVDLVLRTNGEERVRMGADGDVTISSLAANDTLYRMVVADPSGRLIPIGLPVIPSVPGIDPSIPCDYPSTHWLSNLCTPYNSKDTYHSPLNGNVGIGTKGPADKLQINDGIYRMLMGDGHTTDPSTLHYDGSSYLGFNVTRLEDNGILKWKTKTDGTKNGGFLFWTSKEGDIKLIPIPNTGVTDQVISDEDLLNPINFKDITIHNNPGVGIQVGIGLKTTSGWDNTDGPYRLYVADGIRTEKIKVDLASNHNWADHVFNVDYKLKGLMELEEFIKGNKHLPGIPSARELKETGIDIQEMLSKQMEKIEELTLYLIELKKENLNLSAEIEKLKVSK